LNSYNGSFENIYKNAKKRILERYFENNEENGGGEVDNESVTIDNGNGNFVPHSYGVAFRDMPRDVVSECRGSAISETAMIENSDIIFAAARFMCNDMFDDSFPKLYSPEKRKNDEVMLAVGSKCIEKVDQPKKLKKLFKNASVIFNPEMENAPSELLSSSMLIPHQFNHSKRNLKSSFKILPQALQEDQLTKQIPQLPKVMRKQENELLKSKVGKKLW